MDDNMEINLDSMNLSRLYLTENLYNLRIEREIERDCVYLSIQKQIQNLVIRQIITYDLSILNDINTIMFPTKVIKFKNIDTIVITTISVNVQADDVA